MRRQVGLLWNPRRRGHCQSPPCFPGATAVAPTLALLSRDLGSATVLWVDGEVRPTKSPWIVPAAFVAIAGMLLMWLSVPPTTFALDENLPAAGPPGMGQFKHQQ